MRQIFQLGQFYGYLAQRQQSDVVALSIAGPSVAQWIANPPQICRDPSVGGGAVAHLVEQLPTKSNVQGSNPSPGQINISLRLRIQPALNVTRSVKPGHKGCLLSPSLFFMVVNFIMNTVATGKEQQNPVDTLVTVERPGSANDFCTPITHLGTNAREGHSFQVNGGRNNLRTSKKKTAQVRMRAPLPKHQSR
ncbi:hypothetical protein PoB_000926400 [Plakobranchus ocellatus]|uniref:Uncharacterized protein n=1 Tax=Plakobranchus ocellatus TaxID=259542 RepID=A0AAV3YKV8_9GAST|nr:hypothetical protein PoB_000926400 [Plakobranchus ocellatus]